LLSHTFPDVLDATVADGLGDLLPALASDVALHEERAELVVSHSLDLGADAELQRLGFLQVLEDPALELQAVLLVALLLSVVELALEGTDPQVDVRDLLEVLLRVFVQDD